jgi:hypothetical protein
VLETVAGAVVAWRCDRSEGAPERQQLIVVERLAVEDEHRVAVDRVIDRPHALGVQRLRNVDAGNLADKHVMQLSNADCHGRFLLCPDFPDQFSISI